MNHHIILDDIQFFNQFAILLLVKVCYHYDLMSQRGYIAITYQMHDHTALGVLHVILH